MKHLDENEIAQFAEWPNGINSDHPESIKHHVQDCEYCMMEILEVAELSDHE